jgi:glycosyltransferase involved in cell wall biosynthesis
MKVLQINSVCGIGSTGRIATDIHDILIEKGHESYIAFGRDLSKNCDNTIRIGSIIDNYTHVAKTRLFDKHGFGSKKATKEFIDKVKRLDPDIIHLHNIHGYYINVEILFDYLKAANKPVIWTLHDCWSFTGHCSHFDYIGCNRWQTGCFDCPQKEEYPKSILFDNSYWNYSKKKEIFTGVDNMTIVTPSNWLADLVRKSFLNNYEIETIYNGIDLSVFKPTEGDFRRKYNIEDAFIILGVSSVWNEKKGLNTFLNLANRLDDSFRVVLVGLNSKQLRDLPTNIIGVEKTNNIEELSAVYSSADLFINASVEETMGLVTVEALACGTPVIVIDSTALPEVVNDKCAYVVNKDSVEEILQRIYQTKKYNHFTKDDCIEHSKQFRKSHMINNYLNLYRKLV